MPSGSMNSDSSNSPAWLLCSQSGLVVVRDFDLLGMFVFPDEAYTPFHINGNRMLPGPIALQCVKAVRRRNAQAAEWPGAIRSEGKKSELQSLMRNSDAGFCLIIQ